MSGVVCVQEDANARIHNVLLIFSFFSVEISELKDLSFFFFCLMSWHYSCLYLYIPASQGLGNTMFFCSGWTTFSFAMAKVE